MPPVDGKECLSLQFAAERAQFASDGNSASIAVCGITALLGAGANSVLSEADDGSLVVAVAGRRRTIAPGAALTVDFDSPLVVSEILLDGVDAESDGEYSLDGSTAATLVGNRTPVASTGAASSVEIRSTDGDGFTFVSVSGILQRDVATMAASEPATGARGTPNSVIAGEEEDGDLLSSLPWYIWIIVGVAAVLCFAACALLYCLLKDDDSNDESYFENSSFGREMMSARANEHLEQGYFDDSLRSDRSGYSSPAVSTQDTSYGALPTQSTVH